MDIPQKNRNRFSLVTHISKASYQKHSNTLELSPRIAMKSVKKIVNEVLLSDVFEKIITDCSSQSGSMSIKFQSDMNDRGLLLEKMHKVIVKFNYSQATYHYATYLMDLINQKKRLKITKEEAAIGSLFLAIKFNEDFVPIASLKSITAVFESNLFYSLESLRKLEITCLKIMDYDISIVSPYTALDLIILKGVIFSSDRTSYDTIQPLKATISAEARKQLEVAIEKTYHYTKYNPFHFALSFICLSRQKNSLNRWNDMFTILYSIREKDIQELFSFIDEVLSEEYSDRIKKRLKNYKRKEIKVNTSISINKIHPIAITSSTQKRTIESYYRKSQRSTSASLEDTPSGRHNNIRRRSQQVSSNVKKSNNKVPSKTHFNAFYNPIHTCSSVEKQSKVINKGVKQLNRPNIFQKNNLAGCRKNSVLIKPSMNMEKASSLMTLTTNNCFIKAKWNKMSSNMRNRKSNNSNDKYSSKVTNEINEMIMKRIKKRISESKERNSQTFTSKESINQSFKNLNCSSEYLVIKNKENKKIAYIPFVDSLKKISSAAQQNCK